jgi:hypothetical protein
MRRRNLAFAEQETDAAGNTIVPPDPTRTVALLSWSAMIARLQEAENAPIGGAGNKSAAQYAQSVSDWIKGHQTVVYSAAAVAVLLVLFTGSKRRY